MRNFRIVSSSSVQPDPLTQIFRERIQLTLGSADTKEATLSRGSCRSWRHPSFADRGLLEVRNDVKYSDATPPDLARCHEFVDIVWYFLRSTDAMLHTQRTGIMLTPPDSDTWDSVY